jgi:acetyl esterase/lipase
MRIPDLENTMHSSRYRSFRLLWLLLLPLAALSLRAVPQQDGVRTETDVAYGEAGGQKLLLDVYQPEGPQKTRPVVILVHGGGWVGGDKKDFRPFAVPIAKAGYVVFSVNYRLVTPGANKWPAQLDDVQRAVRWIRANAAKYGIDPHRVGALGASAGGHLVALLGTRDTRDNSDTALAKQSSRVTCVVDLFGPTDFTRAQSPAVSGVAVGLVANLIGKTPEQAPELYRDASPIAFIDRKTVPFLIFHGTVDPLVPLDQSQRMYDALKTAGIEAKFVKVEGEGHGFVKKENQEQFSREAMQFLNDHLKP